MKTALFITDCSVDSALELRNKLADYTDQSYRLTVVHPYTIATDQQLNRQTAQQAKAEATTRLKLWSAMLGDSAPDEVKLEPLFGNAKQALRIHMLIRSYDYCLTDQWAIIVDTALVFS